MKRNICLISRSLYPSNINLHCQNMKTFEGWGRFWDNIILIAQNNSDKYILNSHKNVYGCLLPIIRNKYLNVIIFTLNGLIQIHKLNKQYKFNLFQASDPGAALLAWIASRIYNKKFLFEVQGDILIFLIHH